jgi:hypothetical protein
LPYFYKQASLKTFTNKYLSRISYLYVASLSVSLLLTCQITKPYYSSVVKANLLFPREKDSLLFHISIVLSNVTFDALEQNILKSIRNRIKSLPPLETE